LVLTQKLMDRDRFASEERLVTDLAVIHPVICFI